MVFIIGLTGGAACGKSTLCQFFYDSLNVIYNDDVPIYDADKMVHELYQQPNIIDQIAEKYPQTLVDNKVDRNILGRLAYTDKKVLSWLEDMFHPIIREKRIMLTEYHTEKAFMIWDIPLLFETKTHHDCDMVITCYCDADIQKDRLYKRKTMNEEKINAILKKQMPSQEKIALSDIAIKMQFHDLQIIKNTVTDFCHALIKMQHDDKNKANIIDLWVGLSYLHKHEQSTY